MPITPTYPGVYIQELASDVRTIVPVDTATTAFIGRALRGPVNQPVTIFGFEDFEQQFGGLWLESKLGFAVRDFFLNGGSKAIIVRAFQADATPAKALLALSPAAKDPGPPAPNAPDPAEVAAQLAAALKVSAAKAAEAQATAAEAQARADLATALAALARAKAQELAALQAEQKAADNRIEQATKGLEADPNNQDLKNKVTSAQEAKGKIDGAIEKATKPAQDAATQAETAQTAADTAKGAADAAKSAAAEAENDVLTAREEASKLAPVVNIEAAYEGQWGQNLALRVTKEGDDRVLKGLADQYGVRKEDLFNLTIHDLKTGAEEYYPNVTLSEGPRRLDRVLNGASQLVRVPENALDSYKGGAPLAHADPSPDVDWWNGDTSRSIVTTPGSDGVPGTNQGTYDPAIQAAILALDKADIFNMLCIPPYDSSDAVSYPVLSKASSYCTKRRAMLIVDPPDWKTWQDAKENFPTKVISPSENAAIFFPRLRQRNPLRDNQIEVFVPCGAVAGVMARTDFRRGVWKAAAGLEATLNGVEGFSVQIDDNANGQLNPLGINCLRVMPAAGPVVWGARTTVGDDRLANQWKYIPVRRMALWIEETLYRNTQWAVFEPNDEPLWSSLRLNIGNFMNGLFRQGAFQGKAPAEAYFVKCDGATTTQTDIDRGIVNVIVGFAPLKPAEFVIISIKQITNQGAAA